ncbi:MAG: hypothetical protein LBB11_00295 [Puniceicoccales bacterium]|jgi:hypothetical protein|nr:hypothetical protein [Puniceicoccales bacterium]
MLKRYFSELCLFYVLRVVLCTNPLWGTSAEPSRFLAAKKDDSDYPTSSTDSVCIANPTYDLTFKSLFVGMNDAKKDSLASSESAKNRLISLLNSLCYPEADDDSNEKHIKSIFIEDGTIIEKFGNSKENNRKKTGKTNSEGENALRELRCDIICQCQLSNSSETEKYVLYFDIEMQRKNEGDPIQRFLKYREQLEKKYEGQGHAQNQVRVIAFLGYETDTAVENTRMGRLIKDSETGKVIAARDEENNNFNFNPMISLPAVVKRITKNSNTDIDIMDSKIIRYAGKDWLKLLGVQWWAKVENEDTKNKYYIVPNDPVSQEVRSALEVLKKSNTTEDAFRAEVKRIFDAERTIDGLKQQSLKEGRQQGREEGKIIGMLETCMRNFVIAGEEIKKYQVKGIQANTLERNFIKEIWNRVHDESKKDGEDKGNQEKTFDNFIGNSIIKTLLKR